MSAQSTSTLLSGTLHRLPAASPKCVVFESTGRYRKKAVGALLAASLPAVVVNVGPLEEQIESLEERMDTFVASSAAFRANDEVVRSIPGIGPQVSRTLLAHLPELGQGSRQRVAALVGLAPDNDDSGKQRRTRHICGGRGKVRLGVYQAAVVAIRSCVEMKIFYARLKAEGKASIVALVAVARKLLVLANALIRTMKPYQCRANSVCAENS